MLNKVLINIAIIFLCILGISAEGRAEEWSENNCNEREEDRCVKKSRL